MTAGEQQARLRQALSGVELHRVRQSALDWHAGARTLHDVAAALERSGPGVRTGFGGETGPAAQVAFGAVQARVVARAEQMAAAGAALDDAGDVLAEAEDLAAALAVDAPVPPTPAPRRPDDTARDDLLREAAHGRRLGLYAAEVDARERTAGDMADRMDETFRVAAETLERIGAEPTPATEPEPEERSDDTGRGVSVVGAMTAAAALARPPRGGAGVARSAVTSSQIGSAPRHLGAGAALGAAGLRGSFPRADTPGANGPGAPAVGGAGMRGGGGQAGAVVPGGRGRRTREEERRRARDPFADEDGWTDDDGAAPGVID